MPNAHAVYELFVLKTDLDENRLLTINRKIVRNKAIKILFIRHVLAKKEQISWLNEVKKVNLFYFLLVSLIFSLLLSFN